MGTRLALAIALVALLAPAASARANTYCVSDPGCVSGGGIAQPDVQTALDQAAGNSGPDTVQLGPSTFVAPSASGFTYTAADPVNVIGAGPGATVIQGAVGEAAVGLTVTGSASSTVSQIGFAIPGGADFERALTTTAAVSHISVTAADSASEAIGVVFQGGGSLTTSTVNLPELSFHDGNATTGVDLCGPTSNPSPPCPSGDESVSDSTITASTAIGADGTTGAAVHRVTARGFVDVGAEGTLTIDDSLLLVDSSSDSVGLQAFADSPGIPMDNVTVVGPGSAGSVGVDAESGDIVLRNSIVTGFETAIRRETSANLETDYSDYRGPVAVDTGPDTGWTTENNHLDVDPGFAGAAAGDFRLAPTSPLINAGDPAGPATGDSLTDLAGNPRVSGARLDIGAYEFQFPPPLPPPPPVTKDTTAPSFSHVSETNKLFSVGRASTPVSARKRVKVGTTFRYTLSEAAKVKLVIAQRLPGRRVGKVCRKPSRRNRHRKRCTRFVKKGTLTRTGGAGANSVKFSGRIRRRALKPGRYRVTMTATDAAGNVSKRSTLSFRVVKAPKKPRG